MSDEYTYVTGQDGEVYEVYPTEGLLSFLQRLSEESAAQEAASGGLQDQTQLSYAND